MYLCVSVQAEVMHRLKYDMTERTRPVRKAALIRQNRFNVLIFSFFFAKLAGYEWLLFNPFNCIFKLHCQLRVKHTLFNINTVAGSG
ncbi:hypothetical protein NBG4_70024 [Candidatus Sulfobium mesophilum]|uniref:Uncharacterized protein n=1 Tax=Candidatus Sulfobium mesophilum TaxID=2016548 RepID=A0A2U3QK35_9BACT|nr:hypothetical protein NBG4_70024 [Candidatus Sulfobium mesophilum]